MRERREAWDGDLSRPWEAGEKGEKLAEVSRATCASLRLSPAAVLPARVSSLAASTEAHWTPLGSSGTFGCGPWVLCYLPSFPPPSPLFHHVYQPPAVKNSPGTCVAPCLCSGCFFAPPPLPFFGVLAVRRARALFAFPLPRLRLRAGLRQAVVLSGYSRSSG